MGDEAPKMFPEELRIRKEIADDFFQVLTANNKTLADVVHEALEHDPDIQTLRRLANGDRRYEYRQFIGKLYGPDWLEIGDLLTKLKNRVQGRQGEKSVIEIIMENTCERIRQRR